MKHSPSLADRLALASFAVACGVIVAFVVVEASIAKVLGWRR